MADRLFLTWLADQYGGSYLHLRHLAGQVGGGSARSDAAVRRRVERLIRLGLVRKVDRLRNTWVTPTVAGYEAVGRSHSVWAAPVTRIQHCDAVNRVRLWYESSAQRVQAQGEWLSERRLYAERGRSADWHISDAELRLGGIVTSALEIELHVKTPASRYVDEVLSRLRPDVRTLVYLCPREDVGRLQSRLAWAREQSRQWSSLQLVVRPLPVLAALGPGAR